MNKKCTYFKATEVSRTYPLKNKFKIKKIKCQKLILSDNNTINTNVFSIS